MGLVFAIAFYYMPIPMLKPVPGWGRVLIGLGVGEVVGSLLARAVTTPVIAPAAAPATSATFQGCF